jgi:hypothetical protein
VWVCASLWDFVDKHREQRDISHTCTVVHCCKVNSKRGDGATAMAEFGRKTGLEKKESTRQATYVQRNTEVRTCNNFCSGKSVLHILSVHL